VGGVFPRRSWWGRAAALAAALAALATLSGALAIIYFRPYGYDARGQLGHLSRSVAVATVLAEVHRLASHAFVVVAAVAAILWRVAGRPARTGRVVAGAVVVLAFFVSGHLFPWRRVLPWTATPGSNLSRPTPLLGHDGPFPELVGVNLRYDDALFAVTGRRFGPRAAARVYWMHVAGLPLVSVVLLVLWTRARSRREADHIRPMRQAGADPTS
jgi:quinol-cytochrome oxidoreductase complex cytochrome b subunit